MKTAFPLAVLLLATPAFAFQGQRACEVPVSLSDHLLVCDHGAYELMRSANRFVSVASAPFETLDPLSLGFPDDSLHLLYSHLKQVTSPAGDRVGYAHIFGLANGETGSGTQVTAYYSVEGRFLAARAKEL